MAQPCYAQSTPDLPNRTMYTLVLFCLVAVAAAAPQLGYQAPFRGVPAAAQRAPVIIQVATPVPILLDEREGPEASGVYSFLFQTGDGISRQEAGAPLPDTGAVASQGGWSFTFPDGSPAEFRFVADGDGYRVQSPLLPTPPPMPAHALAQIEKARLEDEAAARAAAASSRQVFTAAQAPSTNYIYPQ